MLGYNFFVEGESVTGQILCSCLLLFTFGAVCVPDTVVWHQWI